MRRTWQVLVLSGVVAIPSQAALAVMGWLAVGAGGPPLPAPGLEMVPVLSRLAAAEARLPGEAGPEPAAAGGEEKGVTLAGVVVGREDRPVPGALVQATYWLFGEPLPRRDGEHVRFELDEMADSGYREVEAVTQADGSFSLPGLPSGMSVGLHVSRKGYMTARTGDIEVPAAEPVRIVLAPGSRIAGRVLDEARKPVPEAQVSLFRPGAQSTVAKRRLPDPVAEERTADDGTFVLEPVEPGKARLGATAQGFLPAEMRTVELPAGQAAEDVVLVLRRGAVVTGRVTGPDGEPVDIAQVTLLEDPDLHVGRVWTDNEGLYRLAGLPPGPRTLLVTARGFQRAVRELEVRPGEKNRLDFRMEAGHRVSGRVVDASGKPLESAVVGLVAPGGIVQWDQTRTKAYAGAGGSFEIEDVETGVYDVQAEAAGYSPARLEGLDVTGSVEGLVLRLGPAASVHGRLLGLGPGGLAGVGVAAFSVEAEGVNALTGGDVDAQGNYRIGSLAAGEWEVMAGTADGADARRRVTIPPGADVELDLEFGGLTLTGRVLYGGQPVRDAHVTGESLDSGVWAGSGSTDREGAFRFPSLKPGSYRLRITSPQGSSHEQMLELTADRDVVVDITGQKVSGQVVDAEDRSPVDLVPVFLKPVAVRSPSGSPSMWTRSDETGAFTLTDVAPGTYRLGTRLDGYTPAETTVEVGDAALDGLSLEIRKTEGLVLEVLGPFGRPPASVEVALVDGTGRAVFAGSHATGENGRVRVSSAPAGSWRVLVSAPGGATVEQAVEVPGPPVRLALPRASTLTVTAPGLNRWSTVTLTGDGGQPFRSVEHGQVQQEWPLWNGRALIHDLPEGRWQVRVTAPDGRTWQEEAVTTVGSPARVVIPEEAPDQPSVAPPAPHTR